MEELANALDLTLTQLLECETLDLRLVRPHTLPEEISQMTRLKELFFSLLADAQGEYHLPDSLSTLSNLTKISVEKVIFEQVPPVLMACTNLKELIMEDCGIKRLPNTLGNLKKLIFLDVSHNQISAIPSSIGELSQLRRLDVSYNQISLSKITRCKPSISHASLDENPNDDDDDQHSEECDSDETEPQYGFPPQICLLPKIKLEIFGNIDLPFRTFQIISKLFASQPDPIIRSLKVFGKIKEIPGVHAKLLTEYQNFGYMQLTNRHEDALVDNAYLDRIIRFALLHDAYLYLEHPLVQKRGNSLWYSDSSPNSYFMGHSPPNISLGRNLPSLIFWVKLYFKNLFPRFLNSIKAKFLLSLMFYLVYLAYLTYYVYMKTTTNGVTSYAVTQLVAKSFDPSPVTSMDRFWPFIADHFLPNLINGPFNFTLLTPPGNSVTQKSYYRMMNLLRIRQHRVKLEPCSLLSYADRRVEYMLGKRYECSGVFSDNNIEKNPYGPDGYFVFSERKPKFYLNAQGPSGTNYNPEGYSSRLSVDFDASVEYLVFFYFSEWLDTQTRLISIDFVVSVDNIDAVSVVSLFFEFLPTGSANSWAKVTTTPKAWVNRGVEYTQIFRTVLGVWVMSFIGYVLQRITSFTKKGYVDSWIKYDIILCGFYIFLSYAEDTVTKLTDYSSSNVEQIHSNVIAIGFLWEVATNILGLTVLASYIRLLFYTGVLPFMGLMQIIVINMLKDLFRFMVFLSIFLMAFSLHFLLAYGGLNSKYAHMQISASTVIGSMFGNFDLSDFTSGRSFYAGFDGILFIVIIMVLLMNFFIAMLSSTYATFEEKAEKEQKKVYFETIYFMKDSPLPPPLNGISFIFSLLQFVVTERINVWAKLLSYSSFSLNIGRIYPIPKGQLIWDHAYSDMGILDWSVDCISLFITWALNLVLYAISYPIIFILSKGRVFDFVRNSNFIMLIGYVIFIIIWTATLPLWIVLRYIHKGLCLVKNWRSLLPRREYHPNESSSKTMTALEDTQDGTRMTKSTTDIPMELIQQPETMREYDLTILKQSDILSWYLVSGTKKTKDRIDLPTFARCESEQFNFSMWLLRGDVAFGFAPYFEKSPRENYTNADFSKFTMTVNSSTGEVFSSKNLIAQFSDVRKSGKLYIAFQFNPSDYSITITISQQTFIYVLKIPRSWCIVPFIRPLSSDFISLVRVSQQPKTEFDGKDTVVEYTDLVANRKSHVMHFVDPFLVYSQSIDSDFTAKFSQPISFYSRDIHMATFTVILIGTSQYITAGFSEPDYPVDQELGRMPGSLGVQVDLSMQRVRLLNCLEGTEPSISDLDVVLTSLPTRYTNIRISVNSAERTFKVFVNDIHLVSFDGRIRSSIQAIDYGVTLNSVGQLVRGTVENLDRKSSSLKPSV